MPTVAERVQNWMNGVLLAVALAAIVLVAFAAHFREIGDVSALDMAQIARNLAEGRGYTTSTPTPLSLAIVPRAEPHPELARPPAYIALLALSMRAFGSTDRVVALTSTFFLLLTAAATYLLGTRLSGKTAGVIGVLVILSTPSVLRAATSGTDAMFLSLMVTVLFLIMVAWRGAGEGSETALAIGTGAICGVAYLTRHEMLVMLLVALVFVQLHRRRKAKRPLLIIVAVFAVIVTPWLLRSYRITRLPIASLGSYELVMRTSFNPGTTKYTRFETPAMHPIREALSQPVPMARKLARGLLEHYQMVPRLFNPYVLAFFIVGLPMAVVHRRQSLMHLMVAASFVLIAIALSLYSQINPVILSLVPVTTVFAVGWMVQVMDEFVDMFCPYSMKGSCPQHLIDGWRARWRSVAVIAVTLFLMIPLGPFLFRETPPHSPPHAATPVTYLSETLAHRPERVLVSDMPSGLAWHADKIVMPPPESPEVLMRMRDAGVDAEALYLSPGVIGEQLSGGWGPWMEWLVLEDSPLELVDDEQLPGVLLRLQ